MRLTSIKLVGFKSFVDPTVLSLPVNLCCVMGPNGSGKSNIIDAVRWVLGESAASRLRGDATTDVIFSGSTGRKPVGQASVELLFDNSDGTIGGEFAQFGEISVKRLVSRDGQSAYYLNGTRCRRRDVTDLFLGTGLGARSYSIMEQGIITQIVESHPEQLRVHLEEAAGISRYKERRKETESRIRSTRENLDRVRDVRNEVDKQLDHLNRQARAAERWKTLKAEQTRHEAELSALEYRALQTDRAGHGERLREIELSIERELAAQRQAEADLESSRVRQHEANENLNITQAEVYKVGAEIARVEQQLAHHRELGERLQHEWVEAEKSLAELDSQSTEDRSQLEQLQHILEVGAPELEVLRQAEEDAQQALQEAEMAQSQWQIRWDQYARQAGEASRSIEVERTRIEHTERESLSLVQRRQSLLDERQAVDLAALESTGHEIELALANQQAAVDQHEKEQSTIREQLEVALPQERSAQTELEVLRQSQLDARGRLSALEVLQQEALGKNDTTARSWLEQHGLAAAARLAGRLRVRNGWEHAVEIVLSGLLESVLVAEPQSHAEALFAVSKLNLTLLDPVIGTALPGTLSEQVEGPAAVMVLLSSVRVADSLQQAQQILAELRAGESVITPSGEWLGPGMVCARRTQDSQVGVLAREREIEQLQQQGQELGQQIAAIGQTLTRQRNARIALEQRRDALQQSLYQAHLGLSELAGQRQGHIDKLAMTHVRLTRVSEELDQLSIRLEELQQQTREAHKRVDSTQLRMAELENLRGDLEAERRRALEQREEARLNQREAVEKSRTAALAVESRRTSLAAIEQALQRSQAQRDEILKRYESIAAQIASVDAPLEDFEVQRQRQLEQRLRVDRQLVEARRVLEETETAVQGFEQRRAVFEQKLVGLHEKANAIQLADQALRLRAEQLAADILAANQSLDDLLQELDAEVTAEDAQRRLEALAVKIQRLEPVNLAAIQEHAEHAERKQYLDAQLDDLESALDTLQGAIRKIDGESRQRFRDTFDKVNVGIQELFPRLFGGGEAHLELTGEDILQAGVLIIARPPGKRVSNIMQLSGGEKALIAVALIFAIFRLNPAPFCILDEVDAPLDDANVDRFNQLVLEMSEHVQFLYVTHNKASMEMCQQLCGVAMREPGVSRLVQVDIEEAAKLAGAA